MAINAAQRLTIISTPAPAATLQVSQEAPTEMRHIKMDTLYPFIELICPICDEDNDFSITELDKDNPCNSTLSTNSCTCGHVFTISEIHSSAIFYY